MFETKIQKDFKLLLDKNVEKILLSNEEMNKDNSKMVELINHIYKINFYFLFYSIFSLLLQQKINNSMELMEVRKEIFEKILYFLTENNYNFKCDNDMKNIELIITKNMDISIYRNYLDAIRLGNQMSNSLNEKKIIKQYYEYIKIIEEQEKRVKIKTLCHKFDNL